MSKNSNQFSSTYDLFNQRYPDDIPIFVHQFYHSSKNSRKKGEKKENNFNKSKYPSFNSCDTFFL